MRYATRDDLNTWMEMYDAKISRRPNWKVCIKMMIDNVDFEFKFDRIEIRDGKIFVVNNNDWNAISFDDNANTDPIVARGPGSRNRELRQIARDRLNVLFIID